MTDIPIVLTKAGVQPASPQTLRDNLVAIALGLDPGLTTNLPGTLIEDIASTDVGALTVIDSAMVDLINSITPYGANEFLLNQLGQIYGVQQGVGSNGSVFVVFTGPAGFLISQGFEVSDGTSQYIVQDGGIIATGGMSAPLFCVAIQSGVFPIPANTVNTLITSLPPDITVTCTNPNAGLPATGAQTEEEYRAQVIQAGLASAQGFLTYLKTQLRNVPGVQTRLVSVVEDEATENWQVIVGGGDPYQVANAIFRGIFDITQLEGSSLLVTGITNANPGVVTTNIAHGYANGQIIQINGTSGISGINGVNFTITVTAPNKFSIGHDTTSSGAWTSGGIVTPNLRNEVVTINDFPDSYNIPFIVPLQQQVAVTFTWNTIAINFVSDSAVSQAATPAIVNYINGIYAGQPINLFQMQRVFEDAVASILSSELISRMDIVVDINGITVAPDMDTGIVEGDIQSYFFTTAGAISVVRG